VPDARSDARPEGRSDSSGREGMPLGFRHVGIYVFRRASLLRFSELPTTPLEASEGLEQLRALEHGMVIRVVETAQLTVGVDVPEDVKIVEKALGGV
jgi:3-deoxy-manno-octulosonate cytidylyltransferase (CMP-KDO synthetase)